MSDQNSIGTINGVAIRAGTAAGAAYVNKVTHPPTSMSAEYQGRPDCSQPNVVLMELKAETNIPPVTVLPISATASQNYNPSSLLFLQSSGAVVSNYVFHWSTASSLPSPGWVQPVNQPAVSTSQVAINQTCSPCIPFSGYNFSNWVGDVASFRQTYKSSTYYLNATDFNNQGTVTTAKFKPDIIRGSNLTTYLSSLSGDSRTSLSSAIRSSISHYNSLYRRDGEKLRYTDDFELVDPKAPSSTFAYQFLDLGDDGTGGPVPYSTTMYYNDVLPATASQLMTLSPKASTRPAREGAFVVQQQEDEIMPWISVNNPAVSNPSSPDGLILSFIRFVNTAGSNIFVPLYSSQPGTTTSPFACDVAWGSLDWSMTLFEGLTVPTSVGTTLSSVPYITVKSFIGLEMQPKSISSLVTFQRTLPLPDPDAIRMAVGIMHARPDSLPAAANDLGTIASTALKFIPTAVSWLKDLFGDSKQKEKALGKAREFVRPKTKEATKKQQTKMEKQIADLTVSVKKLSSKNAPATQLPTYNNNDTWPMDRKSRSKNRKPRNRSRAKSTPRIDLR